MISRVKHQEFAICKLKISESITMEDKYKIPYINACIRTFAKRFNLSIQASHEYLESYKGIDFLIEFYEVEHLQSLDDAVDDLIVCCQNNGGYLKQLSILAKSREKTQKSREKITGFTKKVGRKHG